MQSTSIIRRWIRGSLLITVLVLVLAEGLFLYYSYNDLYGGVERAVENRFSTVVGRLQATGTAGDTATTSESRANVLRRVVEQFDEKDKFEFMLLDAQGVILATSSGTMNRDLTNGTDYGRALTSANGIGSAIFTTPQGERVMAVTMLVPYAAGSIAALRMVTSLTLIDGQWWRTVAICVGLGVLVLAFTVWSGLFFVRSIVRPLGEVEATATKIAKGDMKVRLPDTRYDDEIGRLCKTINQMAEDLAETERLKNEFISSVSHELRTPLTSIRGWVETISNIDDPTNENYRRGLSIIGTETDRLYTMVEELLDFSRLQNGIKMNCEVLDFVAEATDAALFVEARIRQERRLFQIEKEARGVIRSFNAKEEAARQAERDKKAKAKAAQRQRSDSKKAKTAQKPDAKLGTALSKRAQETKARQKAAEARKAKEAANRAKYELKQKKKAERIKAREEALAKRRAKEAAKAARGK